jgi:hypothetical protein
MITRGSYGMMLHYYPLTSLPNLSPSVYLLYPRPLLHEYPFACYHNAVACVSRSLLSLLAVERLHSFIIPTSWLLTFFYSGKTISDHSSNGISWVIILSYDTLNDLPAFRFDCVVFWAHRDDGQVLRQPLSSADSYFIRTFQLEGSRVITTRTIDRLRFLTQQALPVLILHA